MPGFDRTGPEGSGPRTGRMRGLCARPGSGAANRPGAGGGRRGAGRLSRSFVARPAGWRHSAGFGFGRGAGDILDPGSNLGPGPRLETLKSQAGYLEKVLEGIKRRIQKMESGTGRDR